MIALVILSVVSVSFYTAIVYSARQAKDNLDHLYAVQIINSVGAQIRCSRFAAIGEGGAVATANPYEAKYLTTFVETGDPNAVRATTYTVTVRFKGWGQVASATANSLTANIVSPQVTWDTNEWVGHDVMIVSGVGVNQIMRITANNSNTLTVDSKITTAAATGGGWMAATPNNTSLFRINNGKHAEITVTWGDARNYRTLRQNVFVAAPASGATL